MNRLSLNDDDKLVREWFTSKSLPLYPLAFSIRCPPPPGVAPAPREWRLQSLGIADCYGRRAEQAEACGCKVLVDEVRFAFGTHWRYYLRSSGN
jgi:hypothetical protein